MPQINMTFELKPTVTVPDTSTITPQLIDAIRGRLNAITDEQIEQAVATILNDLKP